MTDEEIKKQREELRRRIEANEREWKEYDERYPVIVGAYKPPRYWEQQAEFARRTSALHKELTSLPSTKSEKAIRISFFLLAAIAIGVLVKWLWF